MDYSLGKRHREDNFQTEIVESDLEMDINFQTENRDYSLGKRHREDNFQTEIVESDLEMDINFQTENSDYSLGKRHREDEKEISDEKEVSDEVLSEAPELFGKRFIADPNHGDMLMEVFRVEFQRGGDLSGKILIHDNSNTYKYIYRSDHSQYIKDGGDLLLTGLNRAAISIDSTIAVFWDLNLTNPSEHQPKRITNCKDCFDADDYFFPINSQAECFNYFFQPELFDIPLYEELEDEDGQVCATVTYAFFNEAMQADVEVSLIGEKIKGVYGSITAKNDVMVDPHCESFLFLKDSSESVEVVDGQPIPLPRSVVAVPVKSNLIVCAHLKSKDTDEEFKEDVSFGVELHGKSEKLINSIQVRVTWKRYWDVL